MRLNGFIRFVKGAYNAILKPASTTLTADRDVTLPPGDANHELVSTSATQTFTNKTFDADGAGNSITNIENADIKAAAAIALNKLAATTVSRALVSDGSGFVSASATTATELGYLSGADSNIQDQLDLKASTAYVDAALAGLSWHEAVAVASTANLSLTGEQTIDGVLTSASRILVKNQSAAAENGIYVTAAGAWSRAADADTWAEVEDAAVFVLGGTVGEGTAWVAGAAAGGTLGTTSLPFNQFGAGATYTADGNGIQLSGNEFQLELDGSTLTKSASGLKVTDNTFQPLDATLTSLSALGTAADKFAYTTGADTWAEATITAAGRTLIDDADATAQRATLGLGTMATQAASSVAITGGSITGITDLAVADGGTGASTASAARTNLQVRSSATDWALGDGASKAVTHSFGTKDVMVEVYDKTDDSTILVDTVIRTDINTVTVSLPAGEAPPAAGYRILIRECV